MSNVEFVVAFIIGAAFFLAGPILVRVHVKAAKYMARIAVVAVVIAAAIWWGTNPSWLAAAISIVIAAISLAALYAAENWTANREDSLGSPTISGGRGGDATVFGAGTAIGGRGGASGQLGSGGRGGDAVVRGSGLAAGGEGGHGADVDVWRPPGRSGYESAMRALGMPVDPNLRPFGRGGTDPEYFRKLRIILSLRGDQNLLLVEDAQLDPEHVDQTSLEELNRRLQQAGYAWRARLLDGQYEFFLPR